MLNPIVFRRLFSSSGPDLSTRRLEKQDKRWHFEEKRVEYGERTSVTTDGSGIHTGCLTGSRIFPLHSGNELPIPIFLPRIFFIQREIHFCGLMLLM